MEERRHINLVGPTLLVGIGVILLLNNLGYLAWNMWDILRLWPVLLIAGGLELLVGRHSLLGSLISAIIVLVLIVGGVWLLSSAALGPAARADAVAFSYPYGQETSLRVQLSPAAATLEIGALEDSANVVEALIVPGRGERIRDTYTPGTQGRLSVTSEHPSVVGFAGTTSGRRWVLRFQPDVALDLRVNLAVGDVTVDLRDLRADSVSIEFGAGQVTVLLPREHAVDLRIQGGVGSVVIEAPEGTPVRVRAETALVGRSFPASYSQRDNTFTSPSYEGASLRSEVTVGLGLGSLRVRP